MKWVVFRPMRCKGKFWDNLKIKNRMILFVFVQIEKVMHKILPIFLVLLLGLGAVGVVSAEGALGIAAVSDAKPADSTVASPVVNAVGGPLTNAYSHTWTSIGSWTWSSRYARVDLQHSRNGGPWGKIGSSYTNAQGVTSWRVMEFAAGTYRYRTVVNGHYSSIKTFTFYDRNGGTSSVSADFSGMGGPGQGLKFVGRSSGATPSKYTWSFGDGGSGSGQTVYHRYYSTGWKTVKLTVKFTNGKSATRTRPVYVWVR